MLRFQAFKFELMPDGGQARDMRRFAGSCRFVFNKALAMQQEWIAAGGKKLGFAGLCKAITEWKADPATAWLCGHPIPSPATDPQGPGAGLYQLQWFPLYLKIL